MEHAERIMAEIAMLDDAEQARLMAYVETLKAARLMAKTPALDTAQALDRDALAAELSSFRVSLAGYKFDREQANAR